MVVDYWSTIFMQKVHYLNENFVIYKNMGSTVNTCSLMSHSCPSPYSEDIPIKILKLMSFDSRT